MVLALGVANTAAEAWSGRDEDVPAGRCSSSALSFLWRFVTIAVNPSGLTLQLALSAAAALLCSRSIRRTVAVGSALLIGCISTRAWGEVRTGRGRALSPPDLASPAETLLPQSAQRKRDFTGFNTNVATKRVVLQTHGPLCSPAWRGLAVPW